ncbi:hypothetical protein BHYA_0030g00090 [Botrytis hyacinthi]|uniref:Uncharacterized protein n=1 Tax=Botrytis hyacinthi TaxID=278943 RepID=A0A4Z1H6K0_9HELO|nr:hypothetical protein BHYA_0030g00090 [Botrytis hyacinthi]
MGRANSAIRVQSLDAGIYEISLGAMIIDLVFSPISSILTKLFSDVIRCDTEREGVCSKLESRYSTC